MYKRLVIIIFIIISISTPAISGIRPAGDFRDPSNECLKGIAESFLLKWYPMLDKDLQVACAGTLHSFKYLPCTASGYDRGVGRNRSVQMECKSEGCRMTKYEISFRNYVKKKYRTIYSMDIRCSEQPDYGKYEHVGCEAVIYTDSDKPQFERLSCTETLCK